MAKYKNVFIIDDDPLAIFIAKRLMDALEFAEVITTFTTCAGALEYLQKNLTNSHAAAMPQIILLDINMPVLNGWDFMERFGMLAFDDAVMPSLHICSATVEKDDVEKALRYPFVKNFLLKPLSRDHLRIL